MMTNSLGLKRTEVTTIYRLLVTIVQVCLSNKDMLWTQDIFFNNLK